MIRFSVVCKSLEVTTLCSSELHAEYPRKVSEWYTIQLNLDELPWQLIQIQLDCVPFTKLVGPSATTEANRFCKLSG